MDLSTTYMGLKLKNPIIASSSKLTSQIDLVKKCADSGAGAIVLKSLFEEQLIADKGKLMDQDHKYFWFPEAVDYISSHSRERGVKDYLKLIEDSKKNTDVPIIASINCITPEEWPAMVKHLENSGADGIELNISVFPSDENVKSCDLEELYVKILEEVKKHVTVPVSVKLGSMLTNPFQVVNQMCNTGMDGVVLFNRYFRPDIDIDEEKIIGDNIFSSPSETTLPLRWVSLLSTKVDCDICANTGIHDAEAMIKHLLAGASAVQICTTLYNNGIEYIEQMLKDLENWMYHKNYKSVNDFKGKMHKDYGNAAAFVRVQFLKKALGELV
jgi:dihydroorotate dehydrogenase (fumarate)